MKPTVVFTSFWDANAIVKWSSKDYQVFSIALGIPSYDKIPYLKNIPKLQHFCPTYELLTDYKSDKDWDKYRVEYRKILVARKEEIDSWIKGLEQDKVYMLCCWETTGNTVRCHRELLFDALKATHIWRDKAVWIYRSGSEEYDTWL